MFVISHYSGICLMSSIIFGGYVIYKRNKPEIHSISVMPAIISGMMWGIAQSSWLITNATLGFVIGSSFSPPPSSPLHYNNDDDDDDNNDD